MSASKSAIDKLIVRAIELDTQLWLPKIDELIAAQGVEPFEDCNYTLKGMVFRRGGWVYPQCVAELIDEVEVHYLEPLESTPFGKEIANEIDGSIGFVDAIHELLDERLMQKWDAEHAALVAGDAR